jgi:hypothetical protein
MMFQRSLLTILICVTALTIFPAQPRANAQVTLTYWGYEPPTTGTTRQPRSGGNGQYNVIFGPATTSYCSTSISGKTDTVGMACVSSTWGPTPSSPTPYALAFVSISGGSGGDITVFLNGQGQLPASVPVPVSSATTPAIAVNAYYFPTGSCAAGQTCSSAAVIDEYDELQGALRDDTFVSVVVPSNPALNVSYTNSGNKDGEVNTTQYAVQINADQPTYVYPGTTPPTATGEIFDRWVTGPGGKIGSPASQLLVGAKTTDYAIAIYHSACASGTTWSSTPTISQCVPISCPNGESWSVVYKKCIPTCPDGEFWNEELNRCIPTCPDGETWNPITKNCNAGCHTCARGQICTEWGYECNCLRCSPDGIPETNSQTNHPTVQ